MICKFDLIIFYLNVDNYKYFFIFFLREKYVFFRLVDDLLGLSIFVYNYNLK